VYIAGQDAREVSESSSAYSATYTVQKCSTLVEGCSSILIEFEDLSGNTGTAVSEVMDGGGDVTIDLTAPLLSVVTISSNNNDRTLAKAGDTLVATVQACFPGGVFAIFRTIYRRVILSWAKEARSVMLTAPESAATFKKLDARLTLESLSSDFLSAAAVKMLMDAISSVR
jgi:hypothetical protein